MKRGIVYGENANIRLQEWEEKMTLGVSETLFWVTAIVISRLRAQGSISRSEWGGKLDLVGRRGGVARTCW